MNNTTLEKLLGVSAPWTLHTAQYHDREKLLEVQIGVARSSWFGATRSVRQPGTRSLTWRHLGLGGTRLRVKLECPPGTAIPQAPWSGPEDSPFSHGLTQRLLILIGSGASLAVLSGAFDLDPEEVWRFKRRLDVGKLGASWSPTAEPMSAGSAAAQVQARSEAQAQSDARSDAQSDALAGIAAIDLPEAEHAVWRELLAGTTSLEIRNLGMQLLLSRLRAQFAVARDEDARSLKVVELRRYCEKNINVASREIAQIRKYAQ